MGVTATSYFEPADIADLAQVRLDAWATAYELSAPKTDLVLNRDGIEIDVQPVVVDWVDRRSSRRTGGQQAMRETQADVVFRRPEAMGFDVMQGDRFRVQDVTGIVSRVLRTRGMVFAEAMLDVRSV